MDSETEKPIQDIKVRAVPSGFIIECTDVDGELNGSYESVIEEIPYDEFHDLIINMTPKRK